MPFSTFVLKISSAIFARSALPARSIASSRTTVAWAP
jgi:hypothetical protein